MERQQLRHDESVANRNITHAKDIDNVIDIIKEVEEERKVETENINKKIDAANELRNSKSVKTSSDAVPASKLEVTQSARESGKQMTELGDKVVMQPESDRLRASQEPNLEDGDLEAQNVTTGPLLPGGMIKSDSIEGVRETGTDFQKRDVPKEVIESKEGKLADMTQANFRPTQSIEPQDDDTKD